MGHERREIDIYTCDACGALRFVDLEIDTPPEGWHGTILVVAGGGDSFTFYACKPACRLKAIDSAYEAKAIDSAYEAMLRPEEGP